MDLAQGKVQSLGEFTGQVRQIRADWTVPENKELWFRGEKHDCAATRLRSFLYRPPKHRSLKPIKELIQIEADLFETFQRCSEQLSPPSAVNSLSLAPDCIRTITIDGQHTKAIRAELRECGVTESVIFPDLDGLGRELKQLWEDRQ